MPLRLRGKYCEKTWDDVPAIAATMIPPEVLLNAYCHGIFPMADSREGEVGWFTADPRGVVDLDSFHVPARLRRELRKHPFDHTVDSRFEEVMRCCAEREDTWISDEMIASYVALHRAGFAHSVESWREGELVGGLYGVSFRAAFFGESMFHRTANASKAALVFLVNRLKERGYLLLDSQMTTPLMAQFGARLIPQEEYLERLRLALEVECEFC